MITDGPWEVRKAVRTLSKNGVDVVKVMIDGELISSGGGIKPGVLGFTDEELDVLVSEAHHRGMRVACHARSAARETSGSRGCRLYRTRKLSG